MFSSLIFSRCRRKTWMLTSYLVLKRTLTLNETTTALRPFYFIVHPDLFAQFPKERDVNENSLKRLNEYLDSIYSNQRVAPASLQFYLRNNESQAVEDTFRKVRISLLSHSPRETVTTVLQTCNLSLEYVNSITPKQGQGVEGVFRRPIKWDPSFYAAHGMPNPYAYRAPKKSAVTLSSWLEKNIEKARQNLEATQPIRRQIEQLREKLKQELGLVDVLWESSWGPVQFRACLISLIRLCERHRHELDLKGFTLVFSNETGLCLKGDIILCSDQVPDNWLRFLKDVPRYAETMSKLPQLERELSSLLNGIQIIRYTTHRPTMLAEVYGKQLTQLITAIKRYKKENKQEKLEQDLSDIELVVDGGLGRLTVSPEGRISVPTSCPGFLVIDFLAANAKNVRRKKRNYKRSRATQAKLRQQVIDELELTSLTHDHNVRSEQLRRCWRHLLEDQKNIGVSLKGCHLNVAQFYSVMSNGQICIPWNWEGVSD